MAFLQPENIPSRNDVPERLQQVARHFRDSLPDEVTVWLERTGNGERAALRREFENASRSSEDGHCYLVVLDPTSGIAVIESPTLREIRSWGNRRTAVEHDIVRDAISRRAEFLQGEARGLALDAMPIQHVLALPVTQRSEAAALKLSLPCLTEEDFAHETLPAALSDALGGGVLQLARAASTEEYSDHSRPEAHRSPDAVRRLMPRNESAARAVINPDIVIGRHAGSMFASADRTGEETIRTLDREQERMARHLGAGYRVIRGVAGSGKTLILTHRAQHIARHFPGWRILVVCFNIPLSGTLSNELSGLSNVEVLRIDQVAHRVLSHGERAANGGIPDFDARRREATELASQLPPEHRYDMVLVDEAQDLGVDGLDLAWAMLKPERDHFVIAFDGAQRIYKGNRRWNPPDMTAQGRTKEMTQNYRNTREILDLAISTLGSSVRQVSEEELPDDFDVLVAPEAAARRGRTPLVIACDGLNSEIDAVVEHVRQLRKSEVPRDHIVVLSGSKRLREEVLKRIGNTASMDAQQHRRKVAQSSDVIRIATLQLLKGLEYQHVVVGGANDIWVEADDPEEQDRQRRRLLYVAMTRASETLTVTFSGDGIMNAISQVPELR